MYKLVVLTMTQRLLDGSVAQRADVAFMALKECLSLANHKSGPQ